MEQKNYIPEVGDLPVGIEEIQTLIHPKDLSPHEETVTHTYFVTGVDERDVHFRLLYSTKYSGKSDYADYDSDDLPSLQSDLRGEDIDDGEFHFTKLIRKPIK